MKKVFLFLFTVMLSFSIYAQIKPIQSNGFTIQFCGDLASWYTLLEQNKIDYKCYLYITPEMATMIAGNQITHITFSTGSSFDTKPREGSIFVAEDIIGEPTTSTACTFDNCYAQVQSGKAYYQTVKLDEPYTIKANTGFYFGYIVKNCRFSKANGYADFPVGIDGLAPNGYSGYVELTDATTGEFIANVDMAADMGVNATNLFLAATTVGEAKGFFDTFILGSIYIDNFALPIIDTSNNNPLRLPIKNVGGNDLTSLEYSLDINNEKGPVRTLEMNIAPGKESDLEIPAPEYIIGRNNITLNVSKVNGLNTNVSSSAACIALDNNRYDRKFVVEEGTGTWCGWCPRGIVGLEKMSEKYPDKFIGIAVHSKDKFATSSYNPVITSFFSSGFPNSVINRDPIFVIDPSFDMLDFCYDFWKDQYAPAKVSLAVETVGNGLKATTNTTFAYNEKNADYRLAFVILEEGLTGKQTNNYAGNTEGLEWWGEQGSTVDWTYEHTARDIFSCAGIIGSIPTTITNNQTMVYNQTLPTNNITDINNTSVVALLIDGKTGVILNAAKVEAKNYNDLAGIDSISNINKDTIIYYNIQGMRIEQPSKGDIVICRKGDKVKKIVFN